jgi:DNA-binding response OmpR family regulator
MARKKVLLADDSNTVVMLNRMLFQNSGMDLIVARNGREAVELAKREKPDIILLDVIMPEMDGFEACRALRADDSTKSIPVLMVTTRGEPTNVQTGYEAGCTDYITKPFDAVELMTKLRAFIRQEA